MGLRQIAEQDLEFILENSDDFGWAIRVIAPSGLFDDVYGSSTDIGFLIDPDTGQAVSGRSASVAVRISSLTNGLPEEVTDKTLKPWLVEFKDINGNSYTFKVVKTMPDRTIGVIVCMVELYVTNPN